MINRLVLVALISIIACVSASALPRFASRTGLACSSCHVNPDGGGMRTAFGLSYGRDDITDKTLQDQYRLSDFSTQITDFLSYGVDFRFLAFYQKYRKQNAPDVSQSSFFPMQADVYFNLAIAKRINLFVNPAFGPYNRYEVFGIAKVLPWNGYVKLGRFTPPYGLRFDDHTSFVRQATPFRYNSGQQTGIELGVNPGPLTLSGAVTNGIAGDLDSKLAKAVFGTAEARFKLDPVHVMVGVTSYNDVSVTGKLNMFGGFGTLSLFQRLTVTGDAEWIKGNSSSMSIDADMFDRNTAGIDLKQFALMVEADYPLMQGFDLKFIYDFFDPNTDIKAGAATRYSVGFEFMPFAGVEARPLLRFTKDTTSPNRDITDLQAMFHLYL
jgi:hypothetical protein